MPMAVLEPDYGCSRTSLSSQSLRCLCLNGSLIQMEDLDNLQKDHQTSGTLPSKMSPLSYENVMANLHTPDTSFESIIMKPRFRWCGHVVRLTNNWMPKQATYSELRVSERPACKPQKHFKDCLKDTLIRKPALLLRRVRRKQSIEIWWDRAGHERLWGKKNWKCTS